MRLKEGLNTISIKSVNRLEKQAEIVRTIIYRPKPKEFVEVKETSESTPAVEADDGINTDMNGGE